MIDLADLSKEIEINSISFFSLSLTELARSILGIDSGVTLLIYKIIVTLPPN